MGFPAKSMKMLVRPHFEQPTCLLRDDVLRHPLQKKILKGLPIPLFTLDYSLTNKVQEILGCNDDRLHRAGQVIYEEHSGKMCRVFINIKNTVKIDHGASLDGRF